MTPKRTKSALPPHIRAEAERVLDSIARRQLAEHRERQAKDRTARNVACTWAAMLERDHPRFRAIVRDGNGRILAGPGA